MHRDFYCVSARRVLRIDLNSHAFFGKLEGVGWHNRPALQANKIRLLAIDTAVRLSNDYVVGHVHGTFGIGAWIDEENR